MGRGGPVRGLKLPLVIRTSVSGGRARDRPPTECSCAVFWRAGGQGGFVTPENRPGPGGCCWLLVVLITPAGGRGSPGRDREGGFPAPRRSCSKSGDGSPAGPQGASRRGQGLHPLGPRPRRVRGRWAMVTAWVRHLHSRAQGGPETGRESRRCPSARPPPRPACLTEVPESAGGARLFHSDKLS